MIITYIRSSSYNAYDWCQHKFFLSYVLGFKELSNQKADIGTITHKALELLAQKKLAQQNGQKYVLSAETKEQWKLEQLTTDVAINSAWNHYTKIFDHHNWTDKEHRLCTKYTYDALEFKNGKFNPANMEIIAAERFFDFQIFKDWAYYDYVFNGEKICGYLSLKGSLDLLTSPKKGVIELIDYKTGLMKDWGTGKQKDFNSLRNDPQLRLYHYAASYLYPEYDHIYITIFYLQFKKPITVVFSKTDLEKTEAMIKHRFEEVMNNKKPSLIYPDFRCTKLCHFYKNKMTPDSKKNICFQLRDEVQQLGVQKVTEKYNPNKTFLMYNTGGGRSGVQ